MPKPSAPNEFPRLTLCGALVIALCTFCLNAGRAQVSDARPLQPTPLEAFASQSGTQVAWSQEVGRLDSSIAHAVVSALIIEDAARPPDRMRGVRIELSDGSSKDEVYLGEETLDAYKNAMDEISQITLVSRDRARAEAAQGRSNYFGARLFWYGDRRPRVHVLNAANYFAPGSEGFSLSAFKDVQFRFPEQNASQFSAIIAHAIDQLKNH
jgi:hypothetical protein